jgi:hypothetical protein
VTGSSEGDRGGISRWLNDGGTTVQWRQWVAEGERGAPRGGRVLLLMAARGGGRGRRKRWVGAAGEAVGRQGDSHGLNTVGTVAPLFGPCG